MQSSGRFCAGNPSPSGSAPDTLPDAYPHGSQPPQNFVQAEPVALVRDSQIPPTLVGGASSDSLLTIPATTSEVNAALGISVTPEPVRTGICSPSLSPAIVPPKPTTATVPRAELVASPPHQSSAAVPPTVPESEVEGGEADDSVSEAVPKAKDPMYWRPLPVLDIWGPRFGFM